MPITLDTLTMLLGWVGAIAGVIAYGMVSRGRWAPSSGRFQLTNLFGAGLMALVAATNGVWPSVAANLVWIVIGVQAIRLVLRARRARAAEAAASLVPAVDEVELAA